MLRFKDRIGKPFVLLPVFLWLLFLGPLHASDIRCKWANVEKIVAIADIHGDYNSFKKILKDVELIDESLDWIGGKTHLVQLGDIMDRGPRAREAFDLLRKLEKQAEAAGGHVHMLLGNHEEANIIRQALSTVGYVTPEQFRSFLPIKYRENMEKEIREKYAASGNSDGELEAKLNEFWDKKIIRGYDKRAIEAQDKYYDFFHDKYADPWLLQRNAVIKINRIVFAHGGISETYSTWDLKELNDTIRREIRGVRQGMLGIDDAQFIYKPNAPQWFRGLIQNGEKGYGPNLTRTLKNLNAAYMVVGHTVRKDNIRNSKELSRFNGQVWGIDTGISQHYYKGPLCALIIEYPESFTVRYVDDEKKKDDKK